jgi:hypothetical protein
MSSNSTIQSFLESFRERTKINGNSFREKFDFLIKRWEKVVEDCVDDNSNYRQNFGKVHRLTLKALEDHKEWSDDEAKERLEEEANFRFQELHNILGNVELAGYIDGLSYIIVEIDEII